MTKKKHKELVEEIRLIWCKDCGDGPSRYEYSPDLDDDACEGGVVTIKLCRERARECVAHTLSAVRDGLELPGERWRTDKASLCMLKARSIDKDDKERDKYQFIALRKEGSE